MPPAPPPAVAPATVTPRSLMLGVLTGRGRRADVAIGAAGLAGHQVAEMLVPVVIGVILDAAVTESRIATLLLWLGVLAALFATLTFSWRLGMMRSNRAFLDAEHELRQRVVARVVDGEPRPRGTAAPGAGTVHSLATSDAALVTGVVWLLNGQLSAVAALTTAGVTLLLISPPLALAVAAGIPLAGLLNKLSHPLEERTSRAQASAAGAAALAADLVAGLRVIAGLGAAAAGSLRYRSASATLRESRIAAARAQSAFQAGSEALAGLLLAIVGVGAGWLTLRGQISIGQLVAVIGVVQTLQGPLATLGYLGPSLAEKRASARRIADALSTSASVPEPTDPARATPAAPPARLEIEVGDAVVHVARGELVGLRTDPATAARLLDVLSQQMVAVPGEVLLDGVCLTAVGPAVRAAVHAPPRSAHLFGGSLGTTVAPHGLHPALVAGTMLDDVAAALPGGLDGAVAAGGGNLSGGQRDRVVLARALHRDEPFLVLHDPLTAVDSVTETTIAAALPAHRSTPDGTPRGLLLLTDSPVLLRVCDRVVDA